MEVVIVILAVVAGICILGVVGAQLAGAIASRTEPRRADPVDVLPDPVSLVRLCGDGRVAVVGESHYQPALRATARGRVSGTGLESNIPAIAVLVPEPRNRYDRNAVRVDIDGRPVGYLARELAVRYQPVLNALASRGGKGWCNARLTGGGQRSFGVYLHLGDPERVVPLNQPQDLEVLRTDALVTVTREEEHQDVLEPLLVGSERATVFTELRPGTVERGKYAGQECVEIAVNGRIVGQLTATMSARYRPLMQAVISSGRRPGAEASLYRETKGVQIRLRLPSVETLRTPE